MANRAEGPRDLGGNSFGNGSIANQGNIHLNNNNYYARPSPSAGPVPTKTCLCFGLDPRNANFVDRPALLEDLRQKLPSDVQHTPIALWGPPGSGKTQLALHYAHERYNPQSCSVFWIHAESEVTFVNDVKAIARKAKIDTSSLDGEELLPAVRDWVESQPAWVMVIDGADDVDLFSRDYQGQHSPRGFVREGYNGTVIWTSRDRRILDLIGWRRGLEVGGMDLDEAVLLLEATANHGESFNDAEAALDLIQELQSNPLVISHVAGLMRQQSALPQEMLSQLRDDEQRRKILESPQVDPHRPWDARRSVLSVLSSPVDRLLCDGDYVAYDIIGTVAYLDHRALTRDILRAASGIDGNEVVGQAITRLKYLSLIREDSVAADSPSYEASSLVQEAIRNHLHRRTSDNDTTEAHEKRQDRKNPIRETICRSEAMTVIAKRFPRNPSKVDYGTLSLCKTLLEHAIKVLQWAPQRRGALLEMADLSSRVGDYMDICGRWLEMEGLYQRALEIRRGLLGADDTLTVAVMDRLAHAYLRLDNSDQALDLFSAARKVRVEHLHLDERHPDVMTSNRNIAITHYHLGYHNLVQPRLAAILALRVEVLGKEHLDSAESMVDMTSVMYGSTRRSTKAIDLMSEALAIQDRFLGKHDPKVIRTKLLLATRWQSLDEDVKAKTISKEALDIQQQMWGERHPLTLLCKLATGRIYHMQNKDEMARKLLSEAADCFQEIFGRAHPLTQDALLDLATVLEDLTLAEAIMKEVLGRTSRVSREGHRKTAKYDAQCAEFGGDDPDTLLSVQLIDLMASGERVSILPEARHGREGFWIVFGSAKRSAQRRVRRYSRIQDV